MGSVDDLISWRARVREVRELHEIFRQDDGKLSELEKMVIALAEEVKELRDRANTLVAQPQPDKGEVLAPAVSNIIDRMEALEQLVVDSMELPAALANQLRLTSEIMEVHREASERAAAAQGGLATVVESMRVDMDELTQAVAHLRSKIENRESYAAGLIGRRRAV